MVAEDQAQELVRHAGDVWLRELSRQHAGPKRPCGVEDVSSRSGDADEVMTDDAGLRDAQEARVAEVSKPVFTSEHGPLMSGRSADPTERESRRSVPLSGREGYVRSPAYWQQFWVEPGCWSSWEALKVHRSLRLDPELHGDAAGIPNAH